MSKRVGSVADSAAGEAFNDGTRRTEILRTAEALIATSGLRTSLQEIADAAGILPGSLYHHFESKEAILIELMRRYHSELDEIGRLALKRLDDTSGQDAREKILTLGTAIATCAVRNRAALQMSFFEGPSVNPELAELTKVRPTLILDAMLQTLRAAKWAGFVKSEIDLEVLADRICQSMLHIGLDVIRHKSAVATVAAVMCRILLEGVATERRDDADLDRSDAFASVSEVITEWADNDADASDKVKHVRATARREFGRRGFEATTIRDIAAAAGMATGTVYRVIGSKDQLLASIMQEFGEKVGAGWIAALGSDSTVVEKLDALSWVNISALERFPDEFRIQLAWLRQSAPDTSTPSTSFAASLRQMKTLLAAGKKAGEIDIESPSNEVLARCFISVQWIPENILLEVGPREALKLARDTSLRGVVVRGE